MLDGHPGGMTESLPPRVTHRQSEKMHWAAGGYAFLVLASLIASHATGALSADTDGNRTESGNVTDGGFVPVVFTKVSQIIAREGSCALIDCNVTGDPLPSVQWFNSHGDRLDTEMSGEPRCTVTLNPGSCSLCHQHCTSLNYNLISSTLLFIRDKASESCTSVVSTHTLTWALQGFTQEMVSQTWYATKILYSNNRRAYEICGIRCVTRQLFF